MKLNLSNLSNLSELIDEYNLLVSNKRYCFDGDLEDLFGHSDITVVKTILKAKDFKIDDCTFEPIGCEYGDYLETLVLNQDNKNYTCQAFVEEYGCGADYSLALENIKELEESSL